MRAVLTLRCPVSTSLLKMFGKRSAPRLGFPGTTPFRRNGRKRNTESAEQTP